MQNNKHTFFIGPGLVFIFTLTAFTALAVPVSGQNILANSTFENGDDGWTQVNLGGDYRLLDDIEPRDDCPAGQAGALNFCDPDAGEWMFNAPAKFLGDKSAALDGYIGFASWDWYLDDGGIPDTDPYPNVVIISDNVAIVVLNENPPLDTWTTYHYELNERTAWLWVDDVNPMNDLPLATRAQIQQVLGNITAIRIRGEAIIGDDQGALDNVILAAPATQDRPQLSIRIVGGQMEITWQPTTSAYVLETSQALPGPTHWTPVDTQGNNWYRFTANDICTFFRLRLNQ